MKTAYPNFSEITSMAPKYDLGKWMSAMRDIYVKVHLGANKTASIDNITKNWTQKEKEEFVNWMKYYETGDYLKYKKAQHSYYVNDDLNYFLPNPKPPVVPNPIRTVNDQISAIPEEANQIAENKKSELSKEDKKRIIEEHRRKILGRLNSAEKLLSSQEGKIFAGQDFEKLLSAIYELKKQIQTVNHISVSAQTLIDLITRQANILNKQGYKTASTFMIKFAQNAPGDFNTNLEDLPAGGSVPQGLGPLDNNTPDLSMPAPEPENKEITDDTAVGKFIENLESSGITNNEDQSKADDTNDVDIDQDEVLLSNAQATPVKNAPVSNLDVESPAPGKAENTGITPEEAKSGPTPIKNDFDALIDSAFNNLTVSDVVKKLEEINKIFRNREISRQLAIADIMLDKLGLAPYFPSLGEATSKIMESSQYCLSRVEDILSKLRGASGSEGIDLIKEDKRINSPEIQKVKENLSNSEKQEQQRKDMKKQVENQQLLEKATKPEGEVEGAQQELTNQPVEVEAPTTPPNRVAR